MFFDDLRVPVANRVGEEGKGWTYGKYLLEFERGSGIASAKLRDALKTVSDLAESEVTGRAIDDPDIAVRMSEIEVDIDTLEMTELRVLSALQTGVIIVGFPFLLVLIGLCVSLWKSLREETFESTLREPLRKVVVASKDRGGHPDGG